MSHISFSALKVWNDCPFKYKLNYEDKVSVFNGSEYTAFGTALHEAAELKVQDETVNEVEVFRNKFNSEVQTLREQQSKIDEKLLLDMTKQGEMLAPKIIPALKSRCHEFHITKTDRTEFTARAATVLVTEQVEFDLDTLDAYVGATYPDLRKCLQLVQQNQLKLILHKVKEIRMTKKRKKQIQRRKQRQHLKNQE